MAASTGSLNASVNSYPSFTFLTHPFTNTSFDDNPGKPRGFSDRIDERIGSGSSTFKSMPPPSLPLSPSYFSIPPGLSPVQLLDSPVLLNASNIQPSPTTGALAAQAFNWKSDYGESQQNIEEQERNLSCFSFQPQPRLPPSSSTTMFHSSATSFQSQQPWTIEEAQNGDSFSSGKRVVVKTENTSVQSFSPEISNGSHSANYSNYLPQTQSQTLSRRSDDGYNWRKYGQKQVKGSENPRSYYKCTYPNCPTKKKVEISPVDGQITEIVYKGTHNHLKPRSTRRNSSSSSSFAIPASNPAIAEIPDQSFANHRSGQMDLVATAENSSISMGDDDFEPSKSRDDFDHDEHDAKRWKMEGEHEGISATGGRTVREPKVVVQTTSEIDILDDGYRWRKYGQKVVKGNPNPRSYYKCTHPGCPVRKHIERASHDLRAVITTYEGKHTHDVPAARGSGSHSVDRPLPNNTNNSAPPIRSPTLTHDTNFNPIHNNSSRSSFGASTPQEHSRFALDMLQSPTSFGFSGFGNSMGSYVNQQLLPEHVLSSKAKEEPRDNDMFLESLLY